MSMDVGDVLGADDDERRDGDLGETRLGGRLGPGRLDLILERQLLLVGPQRHRLGQLAHVGLRIVREPHPRLLSRGRGQVAALDRLFLLGEARLSLVRPVPVAEPGADEDETVDELGPRHREPERDPAAERAADDGRGPVELSGCEGDVVDRPR